TGREYRVRPAQQALRARPDAPQDVEAPVIAHQVGIAVPCEAARACAERHQPGVAAACTWTLGFADVGLMIRHAQVFGPELRRYFDGHSGGEREIDHVLVDALSVHIDFDLAAGALHTVE